MVIYVQDYQVYLLLELDPNSSAIMHPETKFMEINPGPFTNILYIHDIHIYETLYQVVYSTQQERLVDMRVADASAFAWNKANFKRRKRMFNATETKDSKLIKKLIEV